MKVVEGESNGQWTSDTYNFATNISELTFQMVGSGLNTQLATTTSNIFYSVNGGLSFSQWTGGVVEDLESNNLIVRIDLNQAAALVKAIAVMTTLE